MPQGQEWNQDTKNAILGILDRRVNASGVAEPVIAPKGEAQFVVRNKPEIRNREQVLEQAQNTARLEFYCSPDWKTNRNQLGRYDFTSGAGAGGANSSRSPTPRRAGPSVTGTASTPRSGS